MRDAEPATRSPRTLAEAYRQLATGDARLVAGRTDLHVALTSGTAAPPMSVIDLWQLDALRGIALDGADLVVGARSTWSELRRSPLVRDRLPALAEVAALVGAAQIQNRGTIGGNIVTARTRRRASAA